MCGRHGDGRFIWATSEAASQLAVGAWAVLGQRLALVAATLAMRFLAGLCGLLPKTEARADGLEDPRRALPAGPEPCSDASCVVKMDQHTKAQPRVHGKVSAVCEAVSRLLRDERFQVWLLQRARYRCGAARTQVSPV